MKKEENKRDFLGLFLSCQADLQAYIAMQVREWQAVDDIMQETAIALWNNFEQYDQSRPFGPWARGRARFEVLNYYKKHKRARLVMGEEAMLAIDNAMSRMEEEVSCSEAQQALDSCMGKLTERSKKMMELRYRKQLGLEEICRVMEMSMAAVKKSMLRTRTFLRDCCEKVIGMQRA